MPKRRAAERMTERSYILVRNLSAILAAQDVLRGITVSVDVDKFGITRAELVEVTGRIVDIQNRLFGLIETGGGGG